MSSPIPCLLLGKEHRAATPQGCASPWCSCPHPTDTLLPVLLFGVNGQFGQQVGLKQAGQVLMRAPFLALPLACWMTLGESLPWSAPLCFRGWS